ncbi:MAG: CapA family protein [Propionivibrio sp.]|uniref:CapA family protein n=1 Tax=Candidatus Propionivibrio dominans TaxID=2954373 RepID=A0A9D7IEA1_9RHOO|nr:CapA family protein [Candidatus Propionivibrio dominans]
MKQGLISFCALLLLMTISAVQAYPVRLVFVGDVMLDEGPGRVIKSGRDPLAPFAAELRDADFTIGNLECPIATQGQPLVSKIFSFRADPRVVPLLKGRFDALSLANNHSGDYGKAAFLQTLSHLEQAGIAYFGGGHDLASAHAPLWIERQGLCIAVLGYNEFKPRSFEAGADYPGVAWSEDSQVVSDIRAARAAGADLVIPFMHWGWEREPEPSQRQRQLARTMIDAGADVVVGSHPHVTQGAEYYRGKLIVYSLGNFVFDGFELPAAKRGWLLRLTLGRQGLLTWETLAAQIDEEGTPHPVPGALTPVENRAGPQQKQALRTRKRALPSVRECVNK